MEQTVENKGVEVQTGEQTLTADSSISDILKQAPGAKEEVETSSEKPADEQQADTTGEVEKTHTADDEEKENQDLIDKGQPVPFQRLQKVVQQRNIEREEKEKIQKDFDEVMSDPVVLRHVLSNRGYSEQDIKKIMQDNNIQDTTEVKKEEKIDYDLTKVEGWQNFITDTVKKTISDELSNYDKKKSNEVQVKDFIATQEKQAKELAANVYKIDYKDATNKMSAYLNKHPEHTSLGHVAILRLAMSEETFKLGEQKGKEQEIKRQKELRSAAVETGQTVSGGDDYPNEDWSVTRILEWKKKHPES